jgi:putative Ca2+/H+ antiporter (TMEM165/GDT1 family)
MTYILAILAPTVVFIAFAIGVLWEDRVNRHEQERAYMRGHVDGYEKAERDAQGGSRWSM